jgi:Skp family chaperone for outer membrane proteins
MARIVNTYPETIEADAAIEKQVDEFEKERKDLIEVYRDLKNEFEEARKDASNPIWSDAEREKKEEALEAKLLEIRDQDRKIRETSEFRQKQIADQRLRMRERIVTKLNEIISAFAEKHGYDLILDRSEGLTMLPAVVYRTDSLDITEDILKLTAPDSTETGKSE